MPQIFFRGVIDLRHEQRCESDLKASIRNQKCPQVFCIYKRHLQNIYQYELERKKYQSDSQKAKNKTLVSSTRLILM